MFAVGYFYNDSFFTVWSFNDYSDARSFCNSSNSLGKNYIIIYFGEVYYVY